MQLLAFSWNKLTLSGHDHTKSLVKPISSVEFGIILPNHVSPQE